MMKSFFSSAFISEVTVHLFQRLLISLLLTSAIFTDSIDGNSFFITSVIFAEYIDIPGKGGLFVEVESKKRSKEC